jgi:hypothetical protein
MAGNALVKVALARSERFELPTLGFEVRCSIQLSYERSNVFNGLRATDLRSLDPWKTSGRNDLRPASIIRVGRGGLLEHFRAYSPWPGLVWPHTTSSDVRSSVESLSIRIWEGADSAWAPARAAANNPINAPENAQEYVSRMRSSRVLVFLPVFEGLFGVPRGGAWGSTGFGRRRDDDQDRRQNLTCC